VAHTNNPSYLEGGEQWDGGLKLAMAKILRDFITIKSDEISFIGPNKKLGPAPA
jgi:hypothetical protein